MVRLSKDLETAVKTVDAFDSQVAALTNEVNPNTPRVESEPQVLQSKREIAAQDGLYLKPDRQINSKELFNEKYRTDRNFKSEYVPFIAENKEIIGETLEFWTKPFPGMSAEFWKVPTNKKVWAPRYVAEQISRKGYNRLTMEDRPTHTEGGNTYTGQLVVSNRVQRLDARPAKGSNTMYSEF